MKIVGRKSEQQLLKKFYLSDKAEFMAVYGRRRIGKTFLVYYFFHDLDCVFFHCTGIKDGKLQQQLKQFTRVIGMTFYQGAELLPKTNWLDSFEQLTQAMRLAPDGKKIVLFFDELPWMATPKSQLLSALEYYWNRFWVFDSRVKLIGCGSSASWILKNLIHQKGGLHNRITRRIPLAPFNLAETKQFLHGRNIHLNYQQILDLYLVMGGVPLYLEQVESGLSAEQAISQACFTKQGLLRQEFHDLFAALFLHHEAHQQLIERIAQSRYGISQARLLKEVNMPAGGRATERLQELEDAGFIVSFLPYGHQSRGIYYRIIDEYTLFYLKWIKPVAAGLNKDGLKASYWQAKVKSSAWQSWAGYAFEMLCYKHLDQIRKALHIPDGGEVGSWRYRPAKYSKELGAQIDLLFDRDDGIVTICEVKYNQKPFVIDKAYAAQLQRKAALYQQKRSVTKQIFISLITANGIKDNHYSQALLTSYTTLDDLFQDE